ncbi:MAG TPA: sulfite exporter TauE/SafE family protein [Phycisphaerae bacterium]|jgi:hypothetical protein
MEPEKETLTAAPTAPPKYRIYSPKAVAIATFLGSTVAGGAIMAINYWRWGQKRRAWVALLSGCAVLGLIIWLAMVLPGNIPNAAYILVPSFLIYGVAQQYQGKNADAHWRNGGQPASNLKGAGIGLLIGIALSIVFVGWILSTGVNWRMMIDAQQSVEFGHDQEVFYSRGATREIAQALGDALKKSGYFHGEQASTVLVAGGVGNREVSFVLAQGAWDKPEIDAAIRAIAEDFATAVGGKPFTVKLVDENMMEKKRIRIE